MSVTFVLTLAIQPGADDQEVRETAQRMAASTERKDGARFYLTFEREPGLLEYIETFTDSDAAEAHLHNQDESLLAHWFSLVSLAAVHVVGPVSDSLRKSLEAFPAKVPPTFSPAMCTFGPR